MPGTIAAFLLYLRDATGAKPCCYFGWREGNPAANLLLSLLFGKGEIALLTFMALRKAEPDRERRPTVHVGER